jgi:hypothetical protein
MTRRTKIIYWISTIWLSSGMLSTLSTGTLQLIKVNQSHSASSDALG